MDFRVLGPLEVRRSGETVDLGGPRQRAVLAALLLRANELVSTDYLCAAAWESGPASPGSNLRTYASGLRRKFRAAGEQDTRLVSHNGAYRLVVRPGELDLATFDALTELGNHALHDGNPARAGDHFARALRLWRGRPLECQVPGPAMRVELARLEERRLAAMQQYALARTELGEGVAVIGELRGLLAEYPLREDLWAQLMLALYQAGRQAEALQAFTTARNTLVTELGIEPGQRLRELQQRILSADPFPAAAAAGTPAGTHASS